MDKLRSFDGLQVGDVVTRISVEHGITRFEFLGFDPKLKGELGKLYGYFLESFGRTRVERWHASALLGRHYYRGYNRTQAVAIVCGLLQERIDGFQKESTTHNS